MKLEEYLRFNRIKNRELAEKLGVSQAFVNLMLHGKRKPSLDLAKKIEKITEGRVSVFELLGINKPKKIVTINEQTVDLKS